MSKIEYRAPLRYIYLDREGIDSLYAQTTARLETQLVSEKERNRGGKVGLGAALKTLLFTDVNANAEIDISGRILEQVTSTLTVEQKLAGLIRYLNRFENEKYFDDIHQAVFRCSQQKIAVFINIETEFDLLQFFWGQERGVHFVNQEKRVWFEISPSLTDQNLMHVLYGVVICSFHMKIHTMHLMITLREVLFRRRISHVLRCMQALKNLPI